MNERHKRIIQNEIAAIKDSIKRQEIEVQAAEGHLKTKTARLNELKEDLKQLQEGM